MPRKILVVNDELNMVKLVRTYLEGAGFQVVVAYDGQEALTIDAHMKNLRRALGDDPPDPRYILTVRGVGYKFGEPEVSDAD